MSSIAHSQATARWRPSALVLASFAVHAAALVAMLAFPGAWPWALGAIAVNHMLLTAAGLWPRSALLGPNLTCLPEPSAARGEVALTFDDGPDPGITPHVLDLLDRHGVRATFFCIAERAARHPALVREIARRGHAVENHSNRHAPTFAFLLLAGLRRDLASAQSTLAALAGQPPRFFRPPMGFRNPLLDPVLHEMGLGHVSWTRRGYDTNLWREPHGIAARLTRGLAAGDILLLHDGGATRVREVLPLVLDTIRREGFKPVTLRQAIDA